MSRVTISNGNSKIGKIPNVSMTPVKSCGNCKSCKDKCYALKSYKMYPSVRKAWDKNYSLAKTDLTAYMSDICEYCETKKPRFFRWHVAGDILNQDYLNHMIMIASACPYTKFLAFTKMHNLDYRQADKMDNLTIVFSMFPSMDMPENKFGFPVAWCQDGTEKRMNSFITLECPGHCDTCGMCWHLPRLGKDVVFNIH